MQPVENPIVIRKDDYDLLVSYLRGRNSQAAFNPREAEGLQAELKKADVVSKAEFPPDVVRLNSRVKVREQDKIMEFTLVTPEKANIKERKVSVMAPLGAALIGFRKGQQVQWEMPSGIKTFLIEEVFNLLE